MSEASSKRISKRRLWAGRVLTALPALMLLMSAAMKLSNQPELQQKMSDTFGYPATLMRPLGVVELACVIVYFVPQMSVLGAVLLTGYLGGAIATHVRIADPFAIPLVLGMLVWAGIYLRDGRLDPLLPLRKTGG